MYVVVVVVCVYRYSFLMPTFTVLYSIFFTHPGIPLTKANVQARTHTHTHTHSIIARAPNNDKPCGSTNMLIVCHAELQHTYTGALSFIHPFAHSRSVFCLHTLGHWGINRIWEFHIAVNFKINGVNQQITTIIIRLMLMYRRINYAQCFSRKENIEWFGHL